METNMKMAKSTEFLVTALGALLAVALLAVGVFAQGSGIRFFGPLSRIVTPNGDGLNDIAIFCVDNPADSDLTGKIYSVLGSEVASMGPKETPARASCPAGVLGTSAQSLIWDGRSNGAVVRSGIYIYRVTLEQKVFSGTLIVVR